MLPLGFPEPHPLPGVVGDLRQWAGVDLPGLDRSADISVWLPPGYEESEEDGRAERYPVLYLHDGHNAFDPATSHAGTTWQADRAALWATEQGRPAIVVAVPCSTTRRGEEYTPHPHPEYGGGEADSYLAFLTDALKPTVDAVLRTRPEPESTLVAGSSLGGVLSLHCWTTRPDVFGAAGVFSPAFWWSPQKQLQDVRDYLSHGPDLSGRRLYLDVGGLEDPGAPERQLAYVRDAEVFAHELRSAGVPLRYVFDSTARHTEAAWAERLPAALTWLLGGPVSPA